MRLSIFMKKAFLLLLLLSTGIQSRAQKGFVQYGGLAGVSFVNLYGNPFIEAFLKSKARVVGGPAVYYSLSKHWAVRSNFFYESKGATGIMPLFDEEGEPLGFYNADIHYNYLTIPLLFDFHFGGKLRGNLTAGPFVGILIHQRSTFSRVGTGESIEQKGTGGFYPWDGGAVVAAGLRYALNKRITLSFESRINFGLANIVSRPVLGSTTIYTIATQHLCGVYYTPGYLAGKVRANQQ